MFFANAALLQIHEDCKVLDSLHDLFPILQTQSIIRITELFGFYFLIVQAEHSEELVDGLQTAISRIPIVQIAP